MKRLKRLSLLMLLLTITYVGNAFPMVSKAEVYEGAIHLCQPVSQDQKSDALRDIHIQKEASSIAILSDASSIYRICNSRPQRVLPVYNASQQRLSGRNFNLFNIYFCLKHNYGWQGRAVASPYYSAVPTDYFIIALRHIIR